MPDVLRYLDHHPHPSEIYLIIEVADRTLNTDCGIKANDYANSDIQEYWMLNLKQLDNPRPYRAGILSSATHLTIIYPCGDTHDFRLC